jgi:hypothetical protein
MEVSVYAVSMSIQCYFHMEGTIHMTPKLKVLFRSATLTLIVALFAASFSVSRAATNGTMTALSETKVIYSYDADDDDDGDGFDFVMGVCYDEAGNILDTDREDGITGTTDSGEFDCDTPIFGSGTEKVARWELRDISTDLDSNDASVFGQILAAPIIVSLGNTGVYQGPPIPAGYQLRTITCDTAVYDAPGGRPVGSNTVKAGQTFFINPTPTLDASGKSWTQVFVSSSSHPYIPTSCVS